MDKKPKTKTPLKISAKSERVVVDEIFDNGTTRLLRASRLPNCAEDDYSIETWSEEREEFIDAWRIEAFVGFTSNQNLKEGDVFFISDGTKLKKNYKPISREKARDEHLLLPWKISREIARMEIKKQFHKLAATRIASRPSERDTFLKRVDKKFKTDKPALK